MDHDLVKIATDVVGDAEALGRAVGTGRQIWWLVGKPLAFSWNYIGQIQEKIIREIAHKAEEKRSAVDDSRKTQPSPAITIPLLEAACQESRDELQEIWASLLANSIIDNGVKIRRNFIDIAKKLEPVDVLVLQIAHKAPHQEKTNKTSELDENTSHYHKERIEKHVDTDDWNVACDYLKSLDLVESVTGPGHSARGYPVLTALGRKFIAACEVA